MMLQSRTDARGVRTEYAYDALGRVSRVSSYAPRVYGVAS